MFLARISTVMLTGALIIFGKSELNDVDGTVSNRTDWTAKSS